MAFRRIESLDQRFIVGRTEYVQPGIDSLQIHRIVFRQAEPDIRFGTQTADGFQRLSRRALTGGAVKLHQSIDAGIRASGESHAGAGRGQRLAQGLVLRAELAG